MAGLEPVDWPRPQAGPSDHVHARALQRIGWALLAMNDHRYRMAERHLAEATAALQDLQRTQGGTES